MKKKETKQNRRKAAPGRKNKSSNGAKKSSSKNHGRRVKKSANRFTLPDIAPWKIIAVIFLIGALGILYLRHVFATQKLLAQVQQMEQQYNQAKRSHDNYRLKYDRMIGPSEIYNTAKSMGFVNGGPAEKVIEVEKE